MLAGFVIWSAAAAVLLGIGLRTRRAKEAARFFSVGAAPRVGDVAGYNRAVGRLWLVAAGGMELLGVPLLFLEQNAPAVLLLIPAVVALVVGMIAAYDRITRRYAGRADG